MPSADTLKTFTALDAKKVVTERDWSQPFTDINEIKMLIGRLYNRAVLEAHDLPHTNPRKAQIQWQLATGNQKAGRIEEVLCTDAVEHMLESLTELQLVHDPEEHMVNDHYMHVFDFKLPSNYRAWTDTVTFASECRRGRARWVTSVPRIVNRRLRNMSVSPRFSPMVANYVHFIVVSNDDGDARFVSWAPGTWVDPWATNLLCQFPVYLGSPAQAKILAYPMLWGAFVEGARTQNIKEGSELLTTE